MNLRPVFPIIFLLTLFLTVGFQCDEADYAAVRDIFTVDILERSSGAVIMAPASTTSDSIVLVANNEYALFSSSLSRAGLMSSTWASANVDPILANEIVAIKVFCDKPIYGAAAGEDLAPKVFFGFDRVEEFSITEFVSLLPKKGEDGWWWQETYVFFNTKPLADTYTFTIEFEDNNGHIFSATASPLQWL